VNTLGDASREMQLASPKVFTDAVERALKC
jgi:hypothetical protein